jgi:adenylate kinase family enzyme
MTPEFRISDLLRLAHPVAVMSEHASAPLPALLLLGPTGSGKTPLGDWLETRGLWGRPCCHFDFGANLRAVVAAGPSSRFARPEIDFLARVLAQGALLEADTFHFATRILDEFIARRGVTSGHWLLMNGLPRHLGQAERLRARLRVAAVVELDCDARVIRERLRRDPAGDRAARTDDSEPLVGRKLALYHERTRPLVDHYRRNGARLITLAIRGETRAADAARELEAARPLDL